MADDGPLQSFHKINFRQSSCSNFTSPSLLTGLVSKGFSDTECTMASPTSILDFKPFSPVKNPKIPRPESRSLWVTRRASLGLLDALIDDTDVAKPDYPTKVLFGSQLKIQVPPLPPSVLSPSESPKSPSDFGIKTRNSHVGSLPSTSSPSPVKKLALDCLNFSLSAAEIELSEDYTRVISYAGPSPETTHIVDDCIVERCCGVVKFSESRKQTGGLLSNLSMTCPSQDFLSSCHVYEKSLGQGEDAHLCRSSHSINCSECSSKEMAEEKHESSEPDDIFSSCS